MFVPVANQTLSFALEEIEDFAIMLDDITTVLASNIRVKTHVCQACGTEIDEMDYEEPEGENLQ